MRKKIITVLIATLLTMSIVGPAATVAGQSNTAEFDGEIKIDGSPAVDGSQYQYDVENLDAVSDFSIELTGSTATAWSNTSVSGIGGGDSTTLDIGGNAEPTGPGPTGEPVVEVTGKTYFGDSLYNGRDFSYSDFDGTVNTEIKITNPPEKFSEINLGGDNGNSATFDVYVVEGESPDQDYTDGTKIASDAAWPSSASGDRYTLSTDLYDVSDTSGPITISLVGTGGGQTYLDSDNDADCAGHTSNSVSGIVDRCLDVTLTTPAPDNIAVESSSGQTADIGSLNDGESASAEIDLSTSDGSLSWTASNSGVFDAVVKVKERSNTVDPSIEVNGNTAGYTGTLADGESTSLNVDSAWILEGTNKINVSVGGDSVSGPSKQVGLDYSHRAAYNKTVSYAGETFSERYNISHSFSSDRSNVTATIPFASSSVVAIRSVETRVGSGAWVDVAPENRALDGSELTVEIGEVGAGEQIDVRAVGSKVRVENGEIAVSEPTMLGEDLNSKIVLESVSSDTRIHVNSTAGGSSTHYTHSESWAEPQAHARFGTDGSQTLRFPNAADGDVARISTLDMGVTPSNGHADVRVLAASEQPEFELRESSTADQVAFEYRDTTSNHKYQLYSLDSEVSRDTDVAQSPVSLTSPGVPERLKIYDLGSTSGGGGGSGVVGPTASRSFGANAAFLIGAAVAGIVALFFAARRWGSGGISSKAFFGVGVVTIGVVSLQVLAPNILADYLGRAIESAFPLLLLGGVVVLVFWLRSRGDDTSIIIQGDSK
jgi:hypothetical protein